ncbi:hypothetical protein [Streptomyces hainanensis]|uniref:Uncharacterized protein n=1 Tax=Streptomyces hainanensis TaxID=402648 RepID=A0A4R4TKX1_9ACTN|nr:hypothetical protein [Streptomyces hainanensis]TDC75763.1 hypothetical protein E1283_11515 [Streptomyces hainanensis]
MSVHKRRWRYAVGPVAALALTLTACNSDEEETTGDAGAAQEQEQDGDESQAGGEDETAEEGGADDGAAPADTGADSDEEQSGDDGGATTESDIITHALGEPSGERMFHENSFGDIWNFDVTVEQVEGGDWDALAGSDLVAEEHPGFDPLFVQLSLTNTSGAYEGPDPTGALLVQADDGGPFEPVNAATAEGLPDWCESPGPDTVMDIAADETQTRCQVVLVGHGVNLTSVDWLHWSGAERWLLGS